MRKLQISFLFVLSLFTSNSIILSNWLEIGKGFVGYDVPVLLTGRVEIFRRPLIFSSIPLSGEHEDSIWSLRFASISDPQVSAGPVSFTVIFVRHNDSWCNFTWWTPTPALTRSFDYLIIETGHWEILGAEFDANSLLWDSYCNHLNYKHYFSQPFPADIRPGVLVQPQSNLDTRYISFSSLTNGDHDSNSALSFVVHYLMYGGRWGSKIFDCKSEFQQYAIDKIGILAFTPKYVAVCDGGISLEAHFFPGPFISASVSLYWEYETAPAVFGMPFTRRGSEYMPRLTMKSFSKSTNVTSVDLQVYSKTCDQDSESNIAVSLALLVIGPLQGIHEPKPPEYSEYTYVQGDACGIDVQLESASAITIEDSPSGTSNEDPHGIADVTGPLTSLADDSCLEIRMYDRFGDGWKSVYLLVFDSNAVLTKHQPNCSDSQSPSASSGMVRYCFRQGMSRDGDWVTITTHGFQPRQQWEVLGGGGVPALLALLVHSSCVHVLVVAGAVDGARYAVRRTGDWCLRHYLDLHLL